MPEAEIAETPQPTKPKSFDWPKVVLAAVLGFALLAGAAYTGYLYGTESAKLKSQISKPQPKTQDQITPTPEATPTPTPPVKDETKDWKTFKSEAYNFEFKYPNNYFIRGKPETYEVLTEKFPLIPFVWILKESYGEMGQAPGITLNFAYTAKDTEVFIRDKQEELLRSWQEFKAETSTYQDASDPKIISITDYQSGALKTKKVERVGPPNAPNQNFTEFYFKEGSLIYALSANSESEVEALSSIFPTFRFLN